MAETKSVQELPAHGHSPLPTWQRLLIWAVVVVGAIVLMILLGRTLLPFVVGAGLAFSFDPLAKWLSRHRVGRTWASLLVTLVTFGLLAGGIAILMPVLYEQGRGFVERLPDMMAKARDMLTGVTGA